MKDFDERMDLLGKQLKKHGISYSWLSGDGNNFIDVVSLDEDVYGIINILVDLKWWQVIKRYKLLKLLKEVYKAIRTAIITHYDWDRLIYTLDKFQIKINPRQKVVVFDNMRYSMVLFEQMAVFPLNTPFQFVTRNDGVVTLEKTIEVVGNN